MAQRDPCFLSKVTRESVRYRIAELILQKRHYCIFMLTRRLRCDILTKSSNPITEFFGMILKLKEIAAISSGATFRSRIEVSRSGNVRLIQMKDLGDDNFVHLDQAVRVEHAEPKPNQFAQVGDIIFRSRGQTNTAALLQETASDAIVAAPLFRIRPNANKVVPDFLLWWINQPASQAYLSSRSEGTMLKMVSKRGLEELAVSLPPLEQQRQAAEFFNLSMKEQRLLEAIKNRRALYAQGILMRMATEQIARNQHSRTPGFMAVTK